ncbi:hypothetical protein [Bradyrhizobium cytisi]|uniref:Uncharacterized protein n=1 Tax=Bradyrhizobium cytisi TaxID=515489 RepID=A0A5S4WW13_9BRAD|nr:hypothetical protein [Bradyrhizobium cytisi]TYL86153.1 hypothetical protein FXB38_08995 [Bradyrhizobium cytisi]
MIDLTQRPTADRINEPSPTMPADVAVGRLDGLPDVAGDDRVEIDVGWRAIARSERPPHVLMEGKNMSDGIVDVKCARAETGGETIADRGDGDQPRGGPRIRARSLLAC